MNTKMQRIALTLLLLAAPIGLPAQTALDQLKGEALETGALEILRTPEIGASKPVPDSPYVRRDLKLKTNSGYALHLKLAKPGATRVIPDRIQLPHPGSRDAVGFIAILPSGDEVTVLCVVEAKMSRGPSLAPAKFNLDCGASLITFSDASDHATIVPNQYKELRAGSLPAFQLQAWRHDPTFALQPSHTLGGEAILVFEVLGELYGDP